jgi:CrcB protein
MLDPVLPYVALGGLVGTVARYGLQGWVQQRLGGVTFPAGTLMVNLAGTLALAFIMRYATGSALLSPAARAGLTIGFCGGFTTMSSFAYESQMLLSDGAYARAGIYIGATLIGCGIAAFAGAALADRLL